MKRFLFLAIFIFSSLVGIAQSPKWTLGITGGPNMVGIQTTGPLRTYLRPNFRTCTGLQLEARLKPWLYLLAVPTYESKGSRLTTFVLVDTATGNTTGEVTPYLNYNYGSLPLLLEGKANKQLLGRPMNLIAGAGIYAAALIGRVDRIRGENVQDSVLGRGFIHDRRVDFGFSACLGAELLVAPRIRVHLRALANKGIYNFNIDAFARARLNHLAGNLLVGVSYALGPHVEKGLIRD